MICLRSVCGVCVCVTLVGVVSAFAVSFGDYLTFDSTEQQHATVLTSRFLFLSSD